MQRKSTESEDEHDEASAKVLHGPSLYGAVDPPRNGDIVALGRRRSPLSPSTSEGRMKVPRAQESPYSEREGLAMLDRPRHRRDAGGERERQRCDDSMIVCNTACVFTAMKNRPDALVAIKGVGDHAEVVFARNIRCGSE